MEAFWLVSLDINMPEKVTVEKALGKAMDYMSQEGRLTCSW